MKGSFITLIFLSTLITLTVLFSDIYQRQTLLEMPQVSPVIAYKDRLTQEEFKNFYSRRIVKKLNLMMVGGLTAYPLSNAKYPYTSYTQVKYKMDPTRVFLSQLQNPGPFKTQDMFDSVVQGNFPPILTNIVKKFFGLTQGVNQRDNLFEQLENHKQIFDLLNYQTNEYLSQYLSVSQKEKLLIADQNKNRSISLVEGEMSNSQQKFIRTVQEHQYSILFSYHDEIEVAANTFNKSACAESIKTMNDFLSNIQNSLSPNQLLLIINDRASFQYSQIEQQNTLQIQYPNQIDQDSNSFGSFLFGFIFKGVIGIKSLMPDLEIGGRDLLPTAVHQIDILPTICWILGLPIPANNLGVVIPDFYFQRQGRSVDIEDEDFYIDFSIAMKVNVLQIKDYLIYLQSQFQLFDSQIYKRFIDQLVKFEIFDYEVELRKGNQKLVAHNIKSIRNLIKREIQQEVKNRWNLLSNKTWAQIGAILGSIFLINLFMTALEILDIHLLDKLRFINLKEIVGWCVVSILLAIFSPLDFGNAFLVAMSCLFLWIFIKYVMQYQQQWRRLFGNQEFISFLVFKSDLAIRIAIFFRLYSILSSPNSGPYSFNQTFLVALQYNLLWKLFKHLLFSAHSLKNKLLMLAKRLIQVLIFFSLGYLLNPSYKDSLIDQYWKDWTLSQQENDFFNFYIPIAVPIYLIVSIFRGVSRCSNLASNFKFLIGFGVVCTTSVSLWINYKITQVGVDEAEDFSLLENIYSIGCFNLVLVPVFYRVVFLNQDNMDFKQVTKRCLLLFVYNTTVLLIPNQFIYLYLSIIWLFLKMGLQTHRDLTGEMINTNLVFEGMALAQFFFFDQSAVIPVRYQQEISNIFGWIPPNSMYFIFASATISCFLEDIQQNGASKINNDNLSNINNNSFEGNQLKPIKQEKSDEESQGLNISVGSIAGVISTDVAPIAAAVHKFKQIPTQQRDLENNQVAEENQYIQQKDYHQEFYVLLSFMNYGLSILLLVLLISVRQASLVVLSQVQTVLLETSLIFFLNSSINYLFYLI